MALPYPNIRPEVFPPIGPFHVGPLTIGPLAVRWYALAYIAGILLGWRYAVSLVKTPKLWRGQAPTLTTPQIDDLILWVTLGVIAGGRLGYVLFYILPLTDARAWMIGHPWEVLEVWKGGMSFHGGVIGVVIAVLGFARMHRLQVWKVADIVVACEPIGQFFGRIANFINGELWGRTTHVPWGMVFCGSHIPTDADGNCIAGYEPRHPSQLYEAALEGVVLFLLLRWATHRAGWLQRRGAITGLFLVGYGVFRIALENVRMPDEGLRDLPYGLTVGIMLSVPMVLVGAWLLWRGLREALPALPDVHEPA